MGPPLWKDGGDMQSVPIYDVADDNSQLLKLENMNLMLIVLVLVICLMVLGISVAIFTRMFCPGMIRCFSCFKCCKDKGYKKIKQDADDDDIEDEEKETDRVKLLFHKLTQRERSC